MRRENHHRHLTLRILAALLILIVVLALLAPTILSTEAGKSIAVRLLESATSYRAEIKSLHLSWFSGQKLEEVELFDKSGTMVFRCQELITDATLWQLAIQDDVGTMKITSPKVRLETRLGKTPEVVFLQAGFLPALNLRTNFRYHGNLLVENGEVDLFSPGFDPAYFRQVSLDLQLPSSGPMHLFAKGIAEQKEIKGGFNIDATYDTVLNADVSLTNFPVRGRAAALTGDAIDLSIKIQATEQKMEATLGATSAQFSAHFNADTDGDTVVLTSPGVIDFAITPALIPGLKQNGKGHFEISSFRMPLAQKEAFSFQGALSLSALPLAQITLQPCMLNISTESFEQKKLLLHLDSPQFRLADMELYWGEPLKLESKEFIATADLSKQVINLQILGDVFPVKVSSFNATVHYGQPMKFTIASTVDPQGKLTAEGTFDPSTLSSQVNIHAMHFPTAIFDTLSHLPASQVLGSSVNITALAQIQNGNGPVKVTLQSPTGRASLDGSVKDGILTLNNSVYAQLSPQLAHLHPEAPISVEIPPQGVSLSLFPFLLDRINIPNMRIELGKVRAENQGNLGFAIGLLKLSQFNPGGDLRVWFAPIDLHIQNGVIACERTDVLIENGYQVCFWGNINLPQDSVDMILGITAKCLERAFGIKGLPDKYVLQLPVRGTLSNIEVDTSGAKAKVAALLLWQQKSLAGAVVKGPAGKLLGELLDRLGPPPDGDTPAPPPKRPFPWEKETSTLEEPVKKKKRFSKEDKPLQQFLNMLK